MSINENIIKQIEILKKSINDNYEIAQHIYRRLCVYYGYNGDENETVQKIYECINTDLNDRTIPDVVDNVLKTLNITNTNTNNSTQNNNENINKNNTILNNTNNEKKNNTILNNTSNEKKNNTILNNANNENNNATKLNEKKAVINNSTIFSKELKKDSIVLNDDMVGSKKSVLNSSTNVMKDNVVHNMSSTTNYIVNNSSTGGSSVFDLDFDTLTSATKKYAEIIELLNDCKVEALGYVASVYNNYASDVSNKENSINNKFDGIKGEIVSTMVRVGAADSAIRNTSFDFNDVFAMLGVAKTGSKVKYADKAFFASNPKAKITDLGNDEFKIELNGYVYKYKEGKNPKLTDSGGNTYNVFIPSGASDYSKLNTVTMLSGAGEKSVMYDESEKPYANLPTASSNSIIIIPWKKDGNESFAKVYQSGISSTTKFIKEISNQQDGCQNIIVGCSAGGGSALKIAAASGDTYDTAICINNAVLVSDVNAKPGFKEQFASLEELKKLDGKNIYFIETKTDPNLFKYNNTRSGNSWDNCNPQNSYFNTGYNLTKENCPNSKIFVITNEQSGLYSNDLWNQMNLKSSYSAHGDYKKVLVDLINNV